MAEAISTGLTAELRFHITTEQATLEHLYLVIISLDPTGRGGQCWSNRWKAALTPSI
jgi:hypothetical protein